MRLQGGSVRPFFDEREVRRVGRILEQVVDEASSLGTRGLDVSRQHIADIGDVLGPGVDMSDDMKS